MYLNLPSKGVIKMILEMKSCEDGYSVKYNGQNGRMEAIIGDYDHAIDFVNIVLKRHKDFGSYEVLRIEGLCFE